MKALALTGLEKAINAYLQLDPETIQRLALLENRLIKIEFTDLKTHFYISAEKERLQLIAESSFRPDTTIHGTTFALLRLSSSGASSQSVFENSVTIKGDMDVAADVRNIIKRIDIDWEEHLSRLAGDAIAHKIFYYTKQVTNFGKDIIRSFQDNIQDFLYDEAKILPTKREIDEFYRDIAKLRNDVERVSLRISRLFPEVKG